MKIPKLYDILWINAEPHAGEEEGGHDQQVGNTYRPVLVCSTSKYNQYGFVVGMPITSHRGHDVNNPFYKMLVPISTVNHHVSGYIIPAKIVGYDYLARHGKIVDHLDVSAIPIIKSILANALGLRI